MRRRVLVATLAAAALWVTIPDAAAAGRSSLRTVCAQRTMLYDTPGEYVVAILHRRDRVRVVAKARGRRWLRVSTNLGWAEGVRLRGWVRAAALC